VLRALDLLLPLRCVVCGRGERLVCAGCRASIRLLGPPLCARCGTPTAWPVERCAECSGRRLPFRTARAAVAYDGAARALVGGWKERGLRRIAAEAAAIVAAVVARPQVAGITFVPGDVERTLWRGHSTAEQLGRALAELWGLPVVPTLTRPGRTPRQRGLSRTARRANVRGSFQAVRAPPARVLLVDDVYTTGATVSAAATELRRAGARSVDVVTFARAIRSR
jgi:predicted amidophosphoribosyltransferase